MDTSNVAQMLRPDDFTSIASYVAAVKALADPPAHPDDAAMADEHAALFALVPRSEATHVAVKNGSWFDPTTWSDGQIPTAGAKVLIPEAISVNYDGVSDTSIFTVRVDGKLLFAPDHNTRLVVDTLVVAKTGLLQIGTSDHPVQDGITADIVIADNGPIDVTWDPLLLSRGVISHGTTDIHGQEKTSFLKLAIDPLAGSTLLHFNDDVAQNGWHVGDKIVVAGTHIDPQIVNAQATSETQDEVRTIKAIYGSTVILDKPLTYSHDTPRADLKGYVADYTRNVVIETQNADDVPVSQRGHVMFMHSPAVDVEYAELDGLGRTDKSVRAVDAETTAGIASDTNVKGRYALHLHETGVAPGSPEAIVKGNAIWGSPGWGIVQHDSSADIENNATYGTFGAGYVAETGNETGAWINNIAINAHGIGVGPSFDKEASDVEAFDLARTGIGFYFEGRMIKVTGNVAADVNEGFVYMARGAPEPILADDLAQPEILHGLSSSDVAAAPIQNFTDNEVIAAGFGLIVIKANPYQQHDVRSVINDFKAWETNIGINLQYTSHYTILNSDFTGPAIAGNAMGVVLGSNTYDIVLDNDSFSNLNNAVLLEKGGTINKGGELGYVFIDVKTHGVTGTAISNLDPTYDKVLTSNQLSSEPAALQLNISWDNIPVWNFSPPENPKVSLTGTKTDSVGTVSYTLAGETFPIAEWQMEGLLTHKGYYTTDAGQHIVVLEEYYSDRATGEIFKTSFPIEIADAALVPGPSWLHQSPAISLGKIDLSAPAPEAKADAASTSSGKSVVINVLGNDVDPSGLAMHVDGTTQPTHGKVTTNSDGTLTYTPDSKFTGTESFKYWVTDQNAKFSEATVTVHVGGSDGSPVVHTPNGDPVVDTPPRTPAVDKPPADTPNDPLSEVPVDDGPPPVAPPHPSQAGGWDSHTWIGWRYQIDLHPKSDFDFEFDIGRHLAAINSLSAFAEDSHSSIGRFIQDASVSAPSLSVNYDKDFGATTDPGSQFGIERASYAIEKLSSSPSSETQALTPQTGGFVSPSPDLRSVFFEAAEHTFDFSNFEYSGSHIVHPETSLLPPMEQHHSSVASGFFFS